ncbi:MAG: SIS domain-containing protein [Bacteroidales bacterium]|nr:SIS domain-containing protein [Bacteroidales bacterium]MBP5765143.1 SIS domain-containing protein [Bacteroidales bacterium]
MEEQLNLLVERYPQLLVCREDIKKAYQLLETAYSNGRKLLVCGNGGSASDSEHIVGELMKEFKLKRKVYGDQAAALKAVDPELGQVLADNLQGALPAICLTGHSSLTTAFMNDANADLIFAQQVNGYGKPGDIFLGISTSGNSKNVLYAAVNAKAKGLKVIGLTGAKENRLMKFADVCIRVPETETYKIQEYHLPVYHCLCMMLENKFFGSN